MTITWNGKELTLKNAAQLDNYHDGIAWFADAVDTSGNEYSVVWEYVEPEWFSEKSDAEKNNWTDFEEFADWSNPISVEEK